MRRMAKTGGRSMFTDDQIRGIRNAFMSGASVKYISKAYHAHETVIKNIIERKTYRRVT